MTTFFDKHFSKLLAGIIILILYLAGQYSYLLFHTLSEMISVAIAWAVFMLAWNSREMSKNNSIIFLGVAYFFVGLLDLVHALAYKGMTVFTTNDTNLATQLWISARYLHSFSFLAFSLIRNRKINFNFIIFGFSVITILILLSIFIFKIFPVCFIEGSGLTAFKIVSEYIICFILIISILKLRSRKSEFGESIYLSLIISIILFTVTEMSFTFYLHPHDLVNELGHFFKILSSFFVYRSLIESGIKEPLNLLFLDIKHSEESLRGMNDELVLLNIRLEKELEERKQTEYKLEEAISELERSNKELEQFAYVASHDLQEPLRMVASYTKLLEKRYGKTLDSTALEYIDFAVDGATRMQLLIKGLLDYSRIASQAKRNMPVDSNKILLDVLKNLEFSIRDADVYIHYKSLPVICCDELQILQLFQNLIGNSIKFRCTDKKPEIFISAEKEDNFWLFSVKDNGIGISPEFFEKIFQIFQRLHSRAEYSGTGIGLAVCKRIVERHGGRIWVESEPGEGTTFFFTMPADGC